MLNQMKRKGIILAAGLGSRLCDNNSDTDCKPLMLVDNISLLIRTIHSLEIAGCIHVIIVLGHQADTIETFIRSKYTGSVELTCVVNSKYTLQNGISVLSAKPFIENEFVLTMADHILDNDIMYRIHSHHPPEGGATLCVDYKMDTIFDIDDATKVLAVESRIKKIGKKLKNYNCIDTGVFIGTNGLMEAIDSVYKKKGDASLSEGVQVLANKGLMEVLDIENAYWQDVDNEDMLKHAERLLHWRSKNLRKTALN
jgi:choline kinase